MSCKTKGSRQGRSLGKGETAEANGRITILYKSVSPCLDVSSGSFASGHGPADVSVAELRNQFSRVILLFCSFYYSHPMLFISF